MRVHHIDSRPPSLWRRLSELFEHRELLLLLAWRDVKVRYAQTFIGVLWGVVQPSLTLLIFVLVFQQALRIDTGGVPYVLFALPGIVAWSYFAAVIRESGAAILQSASMVSKVYFPRLILPLSKTLSAAVELLIGVVLVFAALFYYERGFEAAWLLTPVWLLLGLASALGAGLCVSASTIRYRDVQHVLPFVVQVGLYVTPVAWPQALAPPWLRQLLFLNPMTGVVEGWRASLLAGYPAPDAGSLALSSGVGLALLLGGLWLFGRAERRMADWV